MTPSPTTRAGTASGPFRLYDVTRVESADSPMTKSERPAPTMRGVRTQGAVRRFDHQKVFVAVCLPGLAGTSIPGLIHPFQ